MIQPRANFGGQLLQDQSRFSGAADACDDGEGSHGKRNIFNIGAMELKMSRRSSGGILSRSRCDEESGRSLGREVIDRSGEENVSPLFTGAGAEFDDPVGGLEKEGIVFDNKEGIAL